MADNLLDKASILLTPTAYNDGSMLSVKPENGDGDFTFSRSSAATRVNAQGLVENVQIISSELVSNGNFSQIGTEEVSNGNFSQEGSELVTNGDFSNGTTDWTPNASATLSIDTGRLKIAISGEASGYAKQDIFTIESGKQYKCTGTVDFGTASQMRFYVSNTGQFFDITQSGNFNFTFTSTGTSTQIRLYTYGDGNYGFWDNISVKEVGQDWNLIGTATITENQANIVTTSAVTGISQTNILTVGKNYKLSYNIVSNNNGGLKISGNEIPSIVGDNTYYFTASVAALEILRNSGVTDVTITNISVKEVGQDWTFNNGAAIAEDKATIIGDGSIFGYVEQLSTFVSGKKYKVTLDAIINSGGGLVVKYGLAFADNIGSITTSGSYTFYYTAEVSGSIIIGRSVGGVAYNSSITNISVKEITDDTDLPRINYEGFSYQDVLGSELIVNGTFDTDLSSWINGNSYWQWSSQGAYHPLGSVNNGFQQSFTTQSNKLTFSVEIISGTLAVEFGGVYTFNQSGVYTIYGTTGVVNFKRSGSVECYIDNVSVKEYLGQEVVPDSGCGSWLLEGQSTNLITYSEDFSQWTLGGLITPTLTSGQLSPSGEYNATKISGTIGSSILYITGTTSETATRSIYAKSVSGTGTATLMSYFGNTNNLFTLTEEWQRFELTGSLPDGGTNFYIDFRDSSQTLNEFIIWGAQSEELSYATSYIPTNGATNTRLQDIANNSGNSTLINSTEGVLYAEIAALADDGTNRIFGLSNNSTFNESIILRYSSVSNRISAQVRKSGSYEFTINYDSTDVTAFSKIAFKYKQNDFALWVNGIEVGVASSGDVISGLDTLGFSFVGGNNFFGKAKALAVFPILTNAQLQSLTTI